MLFFNKFCSHFVLFFFFVIFLKYFIFIFLAPKVCKLKTNFSEALLASRNGYCSIKCPDEKFLKSVVTCVYKTSHISLLITFLRFSRIFNFAIFFPEIHQIREIQCLRKLMSLRYYREFLSNFFIPEI